MTRASYRFGVEWLALNNAGDEAILLLADLFNVEPERVRKDVERAKKKAAKRK